MAVVGWGAVVVSLGVAALLAEDSGELNADDRKFVGYFWGSVGIWVALWLCGWAIHRRSRST